MPLKWISLHPAGSELWWSPLAKGRFTLRVSLCSAKFSTWTCTSEFTGTNPWTHGVELDLRRGQESGSHHFHQTNLLPEFIYSSLVPLPVPFLHCHLIPHSALPYLAPPVPPSLMLWWVSGNSVVHWRVCLTTAIKHFLPGEHTFCWWQAQMGLGHNSTN